MEIFKLYGSIFVDSDQAKKSISDTAKNASELGNKLQKTGGTISKVGSKITKGVTAVTGAVVGVGTALTAAATKTADYADNIDKMSQKLQISREAYQELDYVLSQNGMDVDSLRGGMKKLVDTMQSAQSGGKSATTAFESLGVAFQNTDGTLRSQEDVFFDTISALQGMTNEAERNALANDVFGRSASELIPLLNSGAGSMEELRQKAHDLGLVMNDDAVDAGVKFTDTMDTLKRSFEQIGLSLGVEIMPYIQQFADYLIEHMPEIRERISQVVEIVGNLAEKFFGLLEKFLDMDSGTQEFIITLGLLVGALGPVLTAVGSAISFFGQLATLWGTIAPFITGTLIPAIEGLVATIGLPVVAAIGLVIAAIAIWKHNWEDIRDMFIDIAERIVEKLNWLKEKIKSAVEAIKGIVKLPHFKLEGELSLKPPSVPKVSVDWYAKAMNNPMIMTSPTVFGMNSNGQAMAGGEAGSEVVSGTNTLMGMIGDSVNQNSMSKETIVSAISEALANVNLNLSADISANSDSLFESMRVKNAQFQKMTGANAW